MRLYITDAFTTTMFGGNPAGVVICDDAQPGDSYMQALASELSFAETAYVFPQSGEGRFRIRYFTPAFEAEVCGHATIAAFCALRYEGLVHNRDRCIVHTNAGALNVDIDGDRIWMDMASPVTLGSLQQQDIPVLYHAFGLDRSSAPPSLTPEIISSGLPDIMLPVTEKALFEMQPNLDEITRLSKKYDAVGIHAFALCDDCTARCRNFAPLYGIDEEPATGTSNGALSYYLYKRELVKLDVPNRFIQGESMGRPSSVLSMLTDTRNGLLVRIGGSGVIIASGVL